MIGAGGPRGGLKRVRSFSGIGGRFGVEKAQYWITGQGSEKGIVGVSSEFHVAATNRVDNQVCGDGK